ncbi:hypothetical protein, partial [Sessilibacter corallicola]|uniref:hypothetical protein n=1 Tax=Sessilibacter corallicola TaxID=2904075 RepID=UPI00333E5550
MTSIATEELFSAQPLLRAGYLYHNLWSFLRMFIGETPRYGAAETQCRLSRGGRAFCGRNVLEQ